MIDYSTTHGEVAAALDHIAETLAEHELLHVQEQDKDNPNLWTVAARDDSGYINIGFVGWSDVTNDVAFVAHNASRGTHDTEEGVQEDDSTALYTCADVDTFLLYLTGEVREIEADYRDIALKKGLDRGAGV